ncbi:uncharacterized protein A4U43_C06F4230 [Asparagus officinalis]|uniref:Uncharacterized protein n=1 Tax=Asparagus officinalis TaxID=4686 RepID=A0A5P1EJG1_ASPOF|nr:uncharacterized protein A4U43_C06F4230 [Asparagus officinalis]
MCPLRIILVLLSAAIAGLVAWRAVRSPQGHITEPETETPTGDPKKNEGDQKVIGDGFWAFMDMASGKYLWRVIKEGR